MSMHERSTRGAVPKVRKRSVVIVLALLCLAALSSFPGTVQAANDPAQPAVGGTAYVTGDWTVETDLYYHDCTIVVTGDLTVQSGASLTLDNVTLKMNSTSPGEYGIRVLEGGTLRGYNDTLFTAVNGANHYTFMVNRTGVLELDHASVKECGLSNNPIEEIGLYVESDDVSINDTVFTNNAYGIIVGFANITLTNSTLNNNAVHGAYFFGTEGGHYRNLNLSSNGVYGLAMIYSVMSIENVTVTKNSFDGFGTYRSNLSFEDVYSWKNSRLGILAQSSNITVHNSTFLQNSMCDVYLTGHNQTSMTGSGSIDLYDVVFTTWHLHDFTQSLNSTYSLNVSVEWADGGAVSGARVSIFNNSYTSDGLEVFSGSTDSNGDITGLQLKVLEESAAHMATYSPHTFKAEKDGLKGSLEFNVSGPWVEAVVLLDRNKPDLNITSPMDGTLFNRSNIRIQGTASDHDGIALVQVNWNGSGWEDAVGTESWYLDMDLADGDHNVSVAAFDPFDVTSSAWVTFSIDTMAPKVAITSPLSGLLTNRTTIQVSGTVEAGAEVFGPDDVQLVNDNGTFGFEHPLSEGMNVIGVKAMDPAGNWNMTEVTVELDSIPPILNITWPPPGLGTTMEKVEVKGKAQGAMEVTVGINGVGHDVPVVNSLFTTMVDLVEGDNAIIITAADDAGNQDIENINVIRDTTRPPVSVRWDGGRLTNEHYITINITTEPGANVTVDGMPVENIDGSILHLVELSEGLNRISVTARDWLGNSNSTFLEVEADLTPPNLTIDRPVNGDVLGSRMVNVFGTALDNIIVVQVELRVDDGQWQNCTGIETWFKTLEIGSGTHAITVRAWDLAGNNMTAKVTFSVLSEDLDREPPVIKVTWPRDGSKVAAGTVTFSGTTTDDIGVASVEWSKDGETWTQCQEPLYLWSTTIDLGTGEHIIYFRVTDTSGKTNATSVSITVRSGGPRTDDSILSTLKDYWLIPILLIAIIIVAVYFVVSTSRYKRAIDEEELIERGVVDDDEEEDEELEEEEDEEVGEEEDEEVEEEEDEEVEEEEDEELEEDEDEEVGEEGEVSDEDDDGVLPEDDEGSEE